MNAVSAAGAIFNSRNPEFQAIYTVQGVTDNVHDLTLTQLVQKQMFRELIQILGTGIGKDFDINKLRYDKIIICSDADIDGMNITSLILCFFFIFMPELIKSGKIYKAMPPLYLMELKSLRKFSKNREWLYDKNEYYNMLNTIIAQHTEMAIEVPHTSKKKTRQAEVKPLSEKEVVDWLSMNSEYKIELDNLGKKAASHTNILEHVCYFKMKCKTEMEFAAEMRKVFPEMHYDSNTQSLAGSWNKAFFTLFCDSLFDKSAYRFMTELAKNESLYVWYRRKGSDDKFTRSTVGDFLTNVSSTFNVNIDQRFKGLGEADPELLFRTTTNPKYRKLLKMTMKDAKAVANMFELVHGKSPKLRESRRDMLASMKLSYSDIDN